MTTTLTTLDGTQVPYCSAPDGVTVDTSVECGLTTHVRLLGHPTTPIVQATDTDGARVMAYPGAVLRCSTATAARLIHAGQACPCRPDGAIYPAGQGQRHLPRQLRREYINPTPLRPFAPAEPFKPADAPALDLVPTEERSPRVLRLTRPVTFENGATLDAGTVVAVPEHVAARVLARGQAQPA